MNAHTNAGQRSKAAGEGRPTATRSPAGQLPPPQRPAPETGSGASGSTVLDQRRYALRAFPSTPRLCRAMTRLNASLWGITDPGDLETIASELAANAVNATRQAAATGRIRGEPVIVFRLLLTPRLTRIETWDKSPLPPQMREPDWESESGRGLFVVNSLTGGHWGYHAAHEGTGKCVWAEVSTPTQLEPCASHRDQPWPTNRARPHQAPARPGRLPPYPRPRGPPPPRTGPAARNPRAAAPASPRPPTPTAQGQPPP